MKSWNAANGVPGPQSPSRVMYAMFLGSEAPDNVSHTSKPSVHDDKQLEQIDWRTV